MYKAKFKVTLDQPLILSGSDRTEVNLNCLDYIPGNIFLGIAARKCYKERDESKTLDLFHNGNVQYGNAYLSIDSNQSYPIPAVWYKHKGKKLNEGIRFYHKLKDEDWKQFARDGIQIKQERQGYFVEKEGAVNLIQAKKGVVLKSAYDSVRRSSEKEKMYLYEYLQAGQEFIFEVRTTDRKYLEELNEVFTGKKYISKSKSAEFGETTFIPLGIDKIDDFYISKNSEYFIYAKSNLAFVNSFGAFTWSPTAKDLGFEKAVIDYEKSQLYFDKLHTRNGKRRTYDADRLIIKKGSVFVIKKRAESDIHIHSDQINRGVGVFLSEGYGQVIVNPSFLDNVKVSNIQEYKKKVTNSKKNKEGLLNAILKERAETEKCEEGIYKSVLKFIENHKSLYNSISSSQWGAVRSLIYQAKLTDNPPETLYDLVFKYNKESIDESGYIYRGRMGKKWEGNKRGVLLKFLEIERNGKERVIEISNKNIDKLLLLSIELPKA